MSDAAMWFLFGFGVAMAIVWGRSYYNKMQTFVVLSSGEDLQKKLEVIRRFGGFNDDFGLMNEEIHIKTCYVNPYSEKATLSYVIYVPNFVLRNARYQESKLRVEELFDV